MTDADADGHPATLIADDLGLLRREPLEFGPYRVVEKLASGGMAEIYKVEAPDPIGQHLALKLIRADRSKDTEFRQMLIDEAKIASLLAHPNIARVIELHESKGELGLLLEYVNGIDLIRAHRVLRDRGAEMPVAAAVYVLGEVLEALEFAHNVRDESGELLNVVHRDVSPGNIMVDVGGRVRVVDWGIARAKNRVAQTDVGHVKGKFRYMAPEQITGQTVGPATDVYSAAVSFWELIAGERIYDDVELPELMLKVSKGDVPSIDRARAGLPRGLANVFKKATAKDPNRRYRTARQFAIAVDNLGIVTSPVRAQERLSQLALTARVADSRHGYQQAVLSARRAVTGSALEGALLRALKRPDRVERVSGDHRVSADQLRKPGHRGDADSSARS